MSVNEWPDARRRARVRAAAHHARQLAPRRPGRSIALGRAALVAGPVLPGCGHRGSYSHGRRGKAESKHRIRVEGARGELEGKGVEFVADTMDSGVCHMAHFRDPDGNALMLHHRYAP